VLLLLQCDENLNIIVVKLKEKRIWSLIDDLSVCLIVLFAKMMMMF
jgi:hypothetical protein